MSIGSADFHAAMVGVWLTSGLDWEFKKFWELGKRDLWPSLSETEAPEGQPLPYCVWSTGAPLSIERMSYGDSGRFEVRNVPWEFQVYARKIDGASVDSKTLAENLAGFIMEHYGGHPTATPKRPELTNGGFLQLQYVSDFSTRVGGSEYRWTVQYLATLDVPVID